MTGCTIFPKMLSGPTFLLDKSGSQTVGGIQRIGQEARKEEGEHTEAGEEIQWLKQERRINGKAGGGGSPAFCTKCPRNKTCHSVMLHFYTF